MSANFVAAGIARISDDNDEYGVTTGVVNDQEAKGVLQTIAKSEDTICLSEPEVITTNGRQTQMSATQSVFVGGTNMEIGVRLSMTPHFLTNVSMFHLRLVATLNQLTGEVLQPDVETVAITNQIYLLPDQTLYLGKDVSSGWLPGMTNALSGPRKLLVFVTPSVVDTSGNPLSFASTNQ